MNAETAHLYRLYDGSELADDGYPPVWHQILKHEVRRDAGHRCIRCLHPYPATKRRPGSDEEPREWTACDDRCRHAGEVRINGEKIETIADTETLESYRQDGYAIAARWRVLTVHHLIDKSDCRWWAMVALCQRCHLSVQSRVEMEQGYLLEHSAWFKPYAAGFYAWKYLGLELNREETMARLPELLDLEGQALCG